MVCDKLRAGGYEGELVLIGNERSLPYQRPPLSKGYLPGKAGKDDLAFRPQSYFEQNNICLLLGHAVTSIDRATRSVVLDNGDKIEFDALVLATGASARKLPADIGADNEKVFSVRNMSDVDFLTPHMTAGRKMVVIGGGYIGLEMAAAAKMSGLDVAILEAAPRILARVASGKTSRAIRDIHRRNGDRVLEGDGVSRILGNNGVVSTVVLASGREIGADLIIVGVGASPNIYLAKEAGLLTGNGIIVDVYGRTSDPKIWAVGDCANFPHGGKRLRLESVGHAIDQASTVAANLLGKERPYSAKPWFWSDQYTSKLQIAGLSQQGDQVIERQSRRGGCSYWYFRDRNLVAVDAIDDPASYMIGKKMIEAGISVSPETISSGDSDLKSLLKAS